MELDCIHNWDCREMREIDDASIGFIVSGPPYWDYVDYSVDDLQSQRESCRNEGPSYDAFLSQVKDCYRECFRVLAPGRYCAVNVATFTHGGTCFPLPYHTVGILEDIGFVFSHDIIWHKMASGRRHARTVVQHPYPGYFKPNNRTEFILMFQKDPGTRFCDSKQEQRSVANRIELDDPFLKEVANNVWHILPKRDPNHPCPFPPEIPHRLIQLYSLQGDVVLDPFMGLGTTARAARMLGRHFVGYELEPRFVEKAQSLIDVPLELRPFTAPEYTPIRKSRRKQLQRKYVNPFNEDTEA